MRYGDAGDDVLSDGVGLGRDSAVDNLCDSLVDNGEFPKVGEMGMGHEHVLGRYYLLACACSLVLT
jgi:hypothetical protein